LPGVIFSVVAFPAYQVEHFVASPSLGYNYLNLVFFRSLQLISRVFQNTPRLIQTLVVLSEVLDVDDWVHQIRIRQLQSISGRTEDFHYFERANFPLYQFTTFPFDIYQFE
jgi:hypothetical protein